MILKASKRAGASALALHLLNEDDNDHIDLYELRGFSADDLEGALREVEAISSGTRCQKYLFSLSLSPPEGESVPIHIFENTIEKIEKKLGLEDQPRAIIFHEKEGRRHAHCVWSRIDVDSMKAIDLPHFKMKLYDISKQLYLEHGWEMPRGFLDSKERNPENFTMAEWQQAKRTGEDPRAIKALLKECWAASDNAKTFTKALEERGFYLAKGDSRSFVALDYFGEVYSLTRAIGVNTKQLQERLGDGANLPSVAVTRENLARRMTKTLENHQKTVREQLRKEAEPAPRKAIIFTESRRTQEYLSAFLQANGYLGKIVSFSGTNSGQEANDIYKKWVSEHQGSDKISGSSQVDRRTALIDHFKNHAEILIATEAAAEGVNLQFCALIVNYDLPWNPQRIEQRIGRCHRYGQKFDVVVINFLNERNQADQRVLELLSEKFNLFNGVFGASDEVLGRIESGIDFEKRISEIYDTCRSPDAIETAFTNLQKELEEHINQKIKDTQQILIENFDEDIHDLLKIKLDQAEERLDKVGRWFWRLTKHILEGKAAFEDEKYAFQLDQQIAPSVPVGKYQLVKKQGAASIENAHTYRLTHPLGEFVLQKGADCNTPAAEVVFSYSGHPTKISAVDQIKGKSGWLNLRLVSVEALQSEEYLVFTAITDDGQSLDKETCEKLFGCESSAAPKPVNDNTPETLLANAKRHVDAQISEIVEANNRFFQEEREKLEKWAEDKVFAAEQSLSDTKNRLRSLKRESRLAASIEDQQRIQTEIRELEVLQRRQRQEIFEVEDEIIEKRDGLIAALEQKLKQRTDIQDLFTIRWKVA